ncbi:hypothetical protein DPV78_000662 [Talaromyces pinophilus]|nr:hypothetical protein DPV78_000662 [Talaromyces pinophilus]
MAKLFRKVASRIRGTKSTDVSWYTERYQTISQGNGTSQSSTANSDDILADQADKQSRLKTWTNRVKKTARRKDLIPNPEPVAPTSPTSLQSCTSSCATIASPAASHLDSSHVGTKQPSFSETTAEVDPEFGFSMRRMRGDFGLYHDKNTPPRLYLDMSRQSDVFSPFRPFSPTLLLPTLDTSDASLSQHSPRYFSTGSYDRYRSISASLAGPPPVAAASSSALSVAKNRFYSQSNLDALGVTRAPTADSGLSPTSLLASDATSATPYSVRSSSSQSHTMRSLSASLLSRKDQHSIKSPVGSRVTSPSYSLASPISFC